MGSKVRLDVAMVERGLVESRQKAQAIAYAIVSHAFSTCQN